MPWTAAECTAAVLSERPERKTKVSEAQKQLSRKPSDVFPLDHLEAKQQMDSERGQWTSAELKVTERCQHMTLIITDISMKENSENKVMNKTL